MTTEGKTVTFTDMVISAKEEVASIHQNAITKSVVTDIENLIAELNGLWVSGKLFQSYTANELSRIGGRLASLHFSLATPRMEALRHYKIAKAAISVKEAGVRIVVKDSLTKIAWTLKKGPTVDDINVECERQVAKTKLLADLHDAEYEKLQSYWYSIPHILESINIRIRILEGDKAQRNYQGTFADGDGLDTAWESGSLIIPDLPGGVDFTQAMGG